MYPDSENTNFYIDFFVEPQVQINHHKEWVFIWCFVFHLYPLNDDKIIRKKLNNGCLENAHLLYYKRYNQQRENEENHYEQQYTCKKLGTTTCHMYFIEEEDITVHLYIVIIPLA